jgi:hypothetical protein
MIANLLTLEKPNGFMNGRIVHGAEGESSTRQQKHLHSSGNMSEYHVTTHSIFKPHSNSLES